MDILLLTGIVIFLGTFAGKLFQWLRIPQVVGYIVAGVLIGSSGLNILTPDIVEGFTPIINIALGFIGFRIGAELKVDIFKRYGCAIYAILLGEGLLAVFSVAALVTLLTGKVYLGLLLGAIASATDPAATTDVLWEYKTKGPLTSTLLAIVALDDGLALVIYGFASVFAMSLMQHTTFSVWNSVIGPVVHLAGSCLLGAVAGYGLFKLMGFIRERDRVFSFSVAAVIITIGIAIAMKLDFILSSMVLGAVFSNFSPQNSHKILGKIEEFTPPIFIFFLVLVGARLQLKIFANISIMLLAITYLVGRTSGKVMGSWLGAYISKAQPSVRKYLGLCLFSQAGVAIGLAMVINHKFSLLGPEGKIVGALVINIITATTFVVQLIGLPSVKFSVIKADEAYRNITREDIISSHKISDVMQADFPVIKEEASLDSIIATVRERDSYHFPVVNNEHELTGILSLGSLREAFMEHQLNPVVIAKDVAIDVGIVVYQNQPLEEAIRIFDNREADFFLAVVESEISNKIVGILEYGTLVKKINLELLERQGEAEIA